MSRIMLLRMNSFSACLIRSGLLVLTVYALLGGAFAQESYVYLGYINDDVIQMQLNVNDTEVNGHYKLLDGTSIGVKGSLDGDGQLRLQTGDDTQQVFHSVIPYVPNEHMTYIEGSVTSASGADKRFELNKIAEIVTLKSQQGRIDVISTYPYFTAPNLQNVNTFVSPEMIEQHNAFFEEGQQDNQRGELYIGWALDANTSVEYASNTFLSLLTVTYMYTGGAHGMTVFNSHNLAYDPDSSSFKPVALSDLFKEDNAYLATLNDYILNDLTQQDAQWVIDGSVTEITSEDLQTFLITPSGIAFIFPQYAMGPYVQGSFYVTVPYEVLQNDLKATNIVQREGFTDFEQ